MFYTNFGYIIESDIILPFAVQSELKPVDIKICASREKSEMYSQDLDLNDFTLHIAPTDEMKCLLAESQGCIILDIEEFLCFKFVKHASYYEFQYFFYDQYPHEWKERLIGRLGMTIMFSWIGLIILHGSAVCKDGKAMAFIADSNSGKSSMAAIYVSKGWQLIADELVIFNLQNNLPLLMPSSNHLHLSNHSLNMVDFNNWPIKKLKFNIKNAFVDINEDTNMVHIPEFAYSKQSCICDSIFILNRNKNENISISTYNKAQAVVKFLHFMYSPLAYPFMRKSLLQLSGLVKLQQLNFYDCFSQFSSICDYLEGGL